MPSVLSKFNSAVIAVVEQDSNSKPPYMRAGDPTPQSCVDWERACKRYANTKDIPADKVVKRTLDGIEDVRFIEWIELDRERFEAMTSLNLWPFSAKLISPPTGRTTPASLSLA
jgi:hypothetical protein